MNEVSTQGMDTPRPVAQPVEVSPQAAASDRPRLAGVVETSGRTLPQKGNRAERNDANDRAPNKQPADEKVGEAVVELNNYLQATEREIRISVDDDSGQPVIRVMDGKTEEVIRQIPNELVLRLAQNLKDDEDVNLLDARI